MCLLTIPIVIPPCSCWELNSGPLEEQPVLLTSEPSLQLYYPHYTEKGLRCQQGHKAVILLGLSYPSLCPLPEHLKPCVEHCSLLAFLYWSSRPATLEQEHVLTWLGTYLKIHKAGAGHIYNVKPWGRHFTEAPHTTYNVIPKLIAPKEVPEY